MPVKSAAAALALSLVALLGSACPTFAQMALPSINDPIVVTAPSKLAPGEKPSAWKRAETDNVVVYSDGSDDQLRRIITNLERMHALLTRLYRPPGFSEEPPRLKIVLFDSPAALRDLGLRNSRSEEGPFAKPFIGQRYYDPRPDGSVLAMARVDQIVDINTSKARDADCEDMAGAGLDCIGTPPGNRPPVTRPWEAVLYGAYAQHLVFNYRRVPSPRWYYDGIGAVFSTIVFKKDGSVEYGRPPDGYRAVLRSYGRLDTAAVLTGEYLHKPSLRMDWTPYHAWVLTHYFVLSNLKTEQRNQFTRYMNEIARGETMAEAAKAFGSMTQIRRDIMAHAERPHDFATTKKGKIEPAPPVVPLSQTAADALMASLSLQP